MAKQGRSKKIGNSYERNFAMKLSHWLTGDLKADVCWRDLGSGSRHTRRVKVGKETALKGDIVCTDFKYQKFFDLFYIDTKCYKEINIWFNNPKNQKANKILREWIKTVKQCPENMWPIMPVKIRDRVTPELLFCFPGFSYISMFIRSIDIEIRIRADWVVNKKQNIVAKLGDRYDVKILYLEQFFKHSEWEVIHAVNQQLMTRK